MASKAVAALPRSVLRSARRPSATAARFLLLRRPLSSTRTSWAFTHNPPPMEPHKQRTPQQTQDIGVGELEGTEFRVEPMRRVGEDDATMRARLVYQSRKRGTLESDLLLSTFADEYLPSMTREQMEQYDLFLDENDWDIYYWATQEPPASASEPPPSIATSDTSSADYAGGAEAAISEATPLDTSPASGGPATTTTTTSEHLTTGGAPLSGDSSSKESAATATGAAAASAEPYRTQAETGEWAQTVGTFKPAYRPVPARWRDSEILLLLREHVKARAKEQGGMAFMPALR
ncbi:DUF339-domain-containing protein [Daldinia sp. FL1419]|nr:DUF339-domain-containing protein [Daldinia sp. FL1419]